MRLFVVLLTACSVNQGSMARFTDVDLMGATLKSEARPSEARCADWCEETADCAAYTYALKGNNERRCYLKKTGFKFNKTKGFSSGIKR